MLELWAVIGGANTRKTSTIRALTGVWSLERRWNVQYLVQGPVETYVEPRGLQEKNISPDEFIREVNATGVHYVIVALRYELAGERPADAVAYLNAFRGAGWNVAGYAVLGRDDLLRGFAGGIAIGDSRNMPSNEIAAQLREGWGIR